MEELIADNSIWQHKKDGYRIVVEQSARQGYTKFRREVSVLPGGQRPIRSKKTPRFLEMFEKSRGERVVVEAAVFPSTENTIVSIVTDDKFNGAHNYDIKPMLRYEQGVGAVYGMEGMPITFVKDNGDGTWQPGLQSEQLLQMLIDRHKKLNSVFPSQHGDGAIMHMERALAAFKARVEERQGRGVMGTQAK